MRGTILEISSSFDLNTISTSDDELDVVRFKGRDQSSQKIDKQGSFSDRMRVETKPMAATVTQPATYCISEPSKQSLFQPISRILY